MNSLLTVRGITLSDIPFIYTYWLESPKDYLVSLGVDLEKLPGREGWTSFLTEQLDLPDEKKSSFCLIWEVDGRPVGHSNINKINLGSEACMHLHIWKESDRKNGYGLAFIRKTLPVFFQTYSLERIFCEPYALNPAPNKLMEKAGFTFIEEVVMIPGSINFEQPVKRWMITKKEVLNNSLAFGNNAY